VSRVSPALLRLNLDWLTILAGVLAAAAPEEGCALLLGQQLPGASGGDVLQVSEVWPCQNRWEPKRERCQRFLLDPREQLLAQRWARQRGVQVLGSAHSHPTTAPLPSASDRAFTAQPALMLIRGIRQSGGRPETLCWWLDDGEERPELLPCRQPARD